MFFEDHSIYGPDRFHVAVSSQTEDFPMAIHRPYECYAIKSGKTTAIINGIHYELHAGEAVLVFPYQRHQYIDIEPGTERWVCTFSPDLVGSFSKNKKGIPLSNKFEYAAPNKTNFKSLLSKKAICYDILAVFDENAIYSEDISETNELLMKILRYISENYLGECKLEDVCQYVGYDYGYISNFFKKMIGQSFKNYVNSLRISEACRLLRETDMNIQTISEKCGFGTIRNFNITFLALTETTPREYRKK